MDLIIRGTKRHTARPYRVTGGRVVWWSRLVDYDWVHSTVCPVLLGHMGIRRSGCIVGQDGGTSQIEVNPTKVPSESTCISSSWQEQVKFDY